MEIRSISFREIPLMLETVKLLEKFIRSITDFINLHHTPHNTINLYCGNNHCCSAGDIEKNMIYKSVGIANSECDFRFAKRVQNLYFFSVEHIEGYVGKHGYCHVFC